MASIETHIKVIKALLESPEDTLTNISTKAGMSISSAHQVLEEIKTVHTELRIKEEDDIPQVMANNYNGAVSREEMEKLLQIVEQRAKKFNKKEETSRDTTDSMDSTEGFEIDSTTKALQLVLSKFKTSKVSEERINNIVSLYKAMEFKYKKEPWALKNLLVNVLGQGMGEEAFNSFIEIVKYYVPAAEGFGGGQQQAPAPAVDPTVMAMMSQGNPGEMNPMALMAGGGGNNNNWLQQLMIADYFEERRRKREREDEERREKLQRERQEADDRKTMNIMMMSMMNQQKNGNDNGIPPGYTVVREYQADGKPIDRFIPIGMVGGNNNQTNPVEYIKAFAEMTKAIAPQQPQVVGSKSDELIASIAANAINKLNVQTDPLESAAKVMEVVEKFRPQGSSENPYDKVNAEIQLLEKKMDWAMKNAEREERLMDKKIAQENTKSYMETIERVVTNVGAPILEKFGSGLAQRAAAGVPMPGAPQPTPQTPQPQQIDFDSMPLEQLEEIAKSADEIEAQNKGMAENLRAAIAKKKGGVTTSPSEPEDPDNPLTGSSPKDDYFVH